MEGSSVHEDLPQRQRMREDTLRSLCFVLLMNVLIPASYPSLFCFFFYCFKNFTSDKCSLLWNVSMNFPVGNQGGL